MTREDVFEKLTEIFQDVFDDDSIELSEETTAEDIEDWDSLSMVSFFSFCNTQGRRVTADEIKSAQTVEDLFKLAGDAS